MKINVSISALATASPASSAVLLIFESFRIRPAVYSATGTAKMATEVAVVDTVPLNALKTGVFRKEWAAGGSAAAAKATVVRTNAVVGTM